MASRRMLTSSKDNLLDLREDGSFRLNMKYFGYLDGLTMTNRAFDGLFGGPPRKAESEIFAARDGPGAFDPGRDEEIVIKMARHARELTGC